jgi:hypothetical protein
VIQYELKVFRYGPSDPAVLPAGWEPIGGEMDDVGLGFTVIAAREYRKGGGAVRRPGAEPTPSRSVRRAEARES